MTPTLLTQLRAMDAVARARSFSTAARELFVTPSAISHHIRRLERTLGVTLFVRSSTGVAPTDAAKDLLDSCARGFEVIAAAVARVRAAARADTTVTLTVAPFFSAQWLTPRLGGLRHMHPTLNVRLHHAYAPVDFAVEDVDAGLVWGDGRWADVSATRVLNGELVAVCSPELRMRLPNDLRADDLADQLLLYEFDSDHWRFWFEAVGASIPPDTRLAQIDDSHALRTAAIDGQGIALFFRQLVAPDLAHGLLVAVLDHTIHTGCDYYLTIPTTRPIRPAVRVLADWILNEVATSDVDRQT